jgi:hypothetical protein
MLTQQPKKQLIQFNSIYLCAKLNSPEANYKVSTGKKMGRVRSKKESENNLLIEIKIIKYKMTMSTLLLLLITTTYNNNNYNDNNESMAPIIIKIITMLTEPK